MRARRGCCFVVLFATIPVSILPLNATLEGTSDVNQTRGSVYHFSGSTGVSDSSTVSGESSMLGLVGVALVAFVVAILLGVVTWKCIRAFQTRHMNNCSGNQGPSCLRPEPVNTPEENQRRLGLYKSVRLSRDIDILSSSTWQLYQQMTNMGMSSREGHVTRVSIRKDSPEPKAHKCDRKEDENNNTTSMKSSPKVYVTRLLTPSCASVQTGQFYSPSMFPFDSGNEHPSAQHVVVTDVISVPQSRRNHFQEHTTDMGRSQASQSSANTKHLKTDKYDPPSLVVQLFPEDIHFDKQGNGEEEGVVSYMETSV